MIKNIKDLYNHIAHGDLEHREWLYNEMETWNNSSNDTKNNMDFSQAKEALDAGKMLARESWNDKEMFIFKQVPSEITIDIIPKMQLLPDSVKNLFIKRGMNINYSNELAVVNVDNVISSWAVSASDIFAEDWYIVE